MTRICCYLSFCDTLTSGSVDTMGSAYVVVSLHYLNGKREEKIAESGAGFPHFRMFTSVVGMCICTYGEHKSAKGKYIQIKRPS